MIKPSVKTYTGFTAPSKKEVKIKADGSTTVNYYYKRNKYTLTLELGDDEISSTSGSGTYYYGEKTTIKATPSSYHNFDKWTLSGDEISTKSEDEYQMPAKNVTLKAYGKNAQIAQALYIKETDDNPYSLIFVYSANHYQKDDVYTYTYVTVDDEYRNFPEKMYQFPLPQSELDSNDGVNQFTQWL